MARWFTGVLIGWIRRRTGGRRIKSAKRSGRIERGGTERRTGRRRENAKGRRTGSETGNIALTEIPEGVVTISTVVELVFSVRPVRSSTPVGYKQVRFSSDFK
jgi:hypothetical protein